MFSGAMPIEARDCFSFAPDIPQSISKFVLPSEIKVELPDEPLIRETKVTKF